MALCKKKGTEEVWDIYELNAEGIVTGHCPYWVRDMWCSGKIEIQNDDCRLLYRVETDRYKSDAMAAGFLCLAPSGEVEVKSGQQVSEKFIPIEGVNAEYETRLKTLEDRIQMLEKELQELGKLADKTSRQVMTHVLTFK
jgi:hypothetical protein